MCSVYDRPTDRDAAVTLPSSPHISADIDQIRTRPASMQSRESPLSIDAGLAFVRSIFVEIRTKQSRSRNFVGCGFVWSVSRRMSIGQRRDRRRLKAATHGFASMGAGFACRALPSDRNHGEWRWLGGWGIVVDLQPRRFRLQLNPMRFQPGDTHDGQDLALPRTT